MLENFQGRDWLPDMILSNSYYEGYLLATSFVSTAF
jgi:hypothetical protein